MIKSVTFALILINVVLFLAVPKDSGFETDISKPLNKLLEFTPSTALEMPWTFITSVFMHANITHIAFNMFTLLMFGVLLESRVGPVRFLIFYLAAGFVGNLLFMGMAFSGLFPSPSPAVNPADIPGLGASGAIMGVLGALGVLTPQVRMMVPVVPIPVPMWIGVIIFAAFNILISFVPSGIGTGAHLGGLAVGVLYGIWLKRRYEGRRRGTVIRYSYE